MQKYTMMHNLIFLSKIDNRVWKRIACDMSINLQVTLHIKKV